MEKAYLKTKHGFIFKVKVTNKVHYTHFGCRSWAALCKAYGLEEDMRITFDIGIPQHDAIISYHYDKDIWVDLDMIPVLPPFEFVILTKCLFKKIWYSPPLIYLFVNTIASLFPFFERYMEGSRQYILHSWLRANLGGEEISCHLC